MLAKNRQNRWLQRPAAWNDNSSKRKVKKRHSYLYFFSMHERNMYMTVESDLLTIGITWRAYECFMILHEW
jgi:hypothetical protein